MLPCSVWSVPAPQHSSLSNDSFGAASLLGLVLSTCPGTSIQAALCCRGLQSTCAAEAGPRGAKRPAAEQASPQGSAKQPRPSPQSAPVRSVSPSAGISQDSQAADPSGLQPAQPCTVSAAPPGAPGHTHSQPMEPCAESASGQIATEPHLGHCMQLSPQPPRKAGQLPGRPAPSPTGTKALARLGQLLASSSEVPAMRLEVKAVQDVAGAGHAGRD